MRAPLRVVLVVAAVLVILAVCLPLLSGSSKAPIPETIMKLQSLAVASQDYYRTYGVWPTGYANFYPEGNARHLLFVYSLASATNDAWQHPIRYQPFDTSLGFGRVLSLGRDGKAGGLGADSDIEVKFTPGE